MEQKKKKLLAAGIVLLVFVLVSSIGAAAVMKINSPIEKLKRALNEEEYETVQMLYEENSTDTNFKSQVDEFLSDFINAYYEKYLNEEKTYEDVVRFLNAMDFYGDEPAALIEKVNKISVSRAAYSKADQLFQSGDYEGAIKLYRSVIIDDVSNYEKVPKKIEECIVAIREEVKKDVATLLKDDKYHDAILLLNSISEKYLNDDLSETKSDIVQQLSAEAESLKENKKYDEAIALLTDDKGLPIDTDLSAQVREYKKEVNIQTLQSLKPYISVKYDTIEKKYTIDPKGQGTVWASRNRQSIFPSITVDTSTSFGLLFGFTNSDWIFTEKIIIDCGDKQLTLPADYSNSERDVGYGSIVEVVAYIHRENNTSGLFKLASAQNLQPIIKTMGEAEKVTVRFKGSKGYKDAAISSAHIEQICNLWKIYKILEEDRTLVSYLI